jgi:hypothetical protein
MINIKNISFISIATRNFLPNIAVLAQSLRKHHPDHKLLCYLVEDMVLPSDSFDGLFNIVPIQELALPGGPNFIFQYSAFELCCALKPYAIMDQLVRFKASAVVYLDADMYLCSPLIPVLQENWKNGSILLTPHLLDTSDNADFAVLSRAGIYNAGFLAFSNCSETKEMLNWWQTRCRHDCYVDSRGGIFVDQRWLDLAVGIFPCISILRNAGINVGYWNIHEKSFSRINSQIIINNQVPLCLFHFSGFVEPRLSKFLNTESLQQGIPDIVQNLASDYAKHLNRAGLKTGPLLEYSFSRFTNRMLITPEMREVIRLGLVECENPFHENEVIISMLSPDNLDIVLNTRADYLVEHYQKIKEHLSRLRRHPVIGRVWRLWRVFVNPNI